MKLQWDTSAFYPVEEILNWRYHVTGQGNLSKQFLIKWKGSPPSFNSWEDYSHLGAKTKADADALVSLKESEVRVVDKVVKGLYPHNDRNLRLYLVHWLGHSKSEDEWVTLSQLKKMKAGLALRKIKLFERKMLAQSMSHPMHGLARMKPV